MEQLVNEQLYSKPEIIGEEILNFEFLAKRALTNQESLFLAVMCRRWDVVITKIKDLSVDWSELKNWTYKTTEITLERCFSKNLQFLKSNKNKEFYEALCNQLGESFETLVVDKDYHYDIKTFYNGQSVFDVFFDGQQPVLDIKEFPKQTLASKQLMGNKASLVLDEVGTGKTVAAIYGMQKVIQKRLDEVNKNEYFQSAAILIICPYGKREDWQNDIRRQLGRNSIIIHQSDNGETLKLVAQNPKKPLIYIMGCAGGQDDTSKAALKYSFKQFMPQRKWDLVVIDECHNCFKNYYGIQSERVILLTATPIVVSGNYVRNFNEYKSLMGSIVADDYYYLSYKPLNPITSRNPSEEDIFVLNFKEDIFNVEINRKIKFVPCTRNERRQDWFYKLRNKKDFFSAMYADQDDQRLVEKMNEYFSDNLHHYSINENPKLEKLIQIVSGQDDWKDHGEKSIIIFCEARATVEMIYAKLSSLANDKTMIGKKYGEIGEIRNVTSNPTVVLERLKGHIRLDKSHRSILITTGKSGGTGLNLGEFQTVIHYELPYTSNELEQRFGRIERADDLLKESAQGDEPAVIENEMLFLLNAPITGESDFETNRMLYYAVNKVNITCKYMPIRNTVLFHPKFSKRVKADAEKYFKSVFGYIASNKGKAELNTYIQYKQHETLILAAFETIKNSLPFDLQQQLETENSLINQLQKVLNDIKMNEVIEQYKEKLQLFLKLDHTNASRIERELEKVLLYYIWLKNTCKFYGIDLVINEDTSTYTTMHQTTEQDESANESLQDGEENNNDINAEQNQLAKEEGENKSRSQALAKSLALLKSKISLQQIELSKLCEIVLKGIEQINVKQIANGIFYYDQQYVNQTVTQFRQGGE